VLRAAELVDAIAAARLSSRNGPEGAEPALLASPVAAGLTALGHTLTNAGEIGAVTAIRSLGHGLFEAAAEPTRRGGGSAMVVHPR
jgi:gamma-glutamyltranspeptidase/glutathione hydrolase